MKVNMNLLSGTDEETKPAAVPPVEEPVDVDTGMEDDTGDEEEDDDDDEIDESDKHSKLKTALLVAAMVGGFAMLVWNMTGLVNNRRMDSQGSATSIVQEMGSLDDFMDRDGSAAVDVNEAPEREVPTDADRDGPAASEDDSSQETKTYENESEEMAALRKELAALRKELAALRKELDQAVKDRELTERDSQGSATSIVQEMESLDDFMGSDGSAAVDVNDAPEREVPTDADRDGPAASEDDSGQETKTYENESEEMAALRKELDQAVKDRELTERELANAEKMLDAALAREAGASGETDGQ